MKQEAREGYSFNSDSLAFRGAFHVNRVQPLARSKPKIEVEKSSVFARFDKAVERKLAHIKKRMEEKDVKHYENQDIHEYEYK
jgi:hypothetical protein